MVVVYDVGSDESMKQPIRILRVTWARRAPSKIGANEIPRSLSLLLEASKPAFHDSFSRGSLWSEDPTETEITNNVVH